MRPIARATTFFLATLGSAILVAPSSTNKSKASTILVEQWSEIAGKNQTHSIDLSISQWIDIPTIPNTVINTFTPRETGANVAAASTSTVTKWALIATSTMPSINAPNLAHVFSVGSIDCSVSICAAPIIFAKGTASQTLLEVWNPNDPVQVTAYSPSVSSDIGNSAFATAMGSNIDPSSFSYAYIPGTTQHFSTTLLSGPDPVETSLPDPDTKTDTDTNTDKISTKLPPMLTNTNSLITTTNTSVIVIGPAPASASNGSVSLPYESSSTYLTTIDASTETTSTPTESGGTLIAPTSAINNAGGRSICDELSLGSPVVAMVLLFTLGVIVLL